jgi:hypothetical protein
MVDLPPGKKKRTADRKQKNKSRSKIENKSTVCGVFLALQVTLFLTTGEGGKKG